MRIYIASSSRSMDAVRKLGELLRGIGHYVYVFCDQNEPAFAAATIVKRTSYSKEFTPQTAVREPLVSNIFGFNMAELNKADCVVLMLPAGKSAHLEAGYAKGRDRKIVLYGKMEAGEWDAMYGMFDYIFNTDETEMMVDWFRRLKEAEVQRNAATSGV